MTLKQFEKERDNIINQVDFASIRTSPDFQCDQTDGVPTHISVCWEKGKAWLEPHQSLTVEYEPEEIHRFLKQCADFGIRECNSVEDFENILKELGTDAEQSAGLTDEEIEELESTEETEDEEPTEDIGMGGIQ